MLKRTLPLLIAVSMLTACASGAPPTLEPLLIPPAHLTELPPEELPDPKSGSLDDLKDNHIESAGIYHRARERYKGLVEWMKQTGRQTSAPPAAPGGYKGLVEWLKKLGVVPSD